MSDIFNRPTVFVKGVATEPLRTPSTQNPASGGSARSAPGAPAKSASAPEAKLGGVNAQTLGPRVPVIAGMTGSTGRRQPRSVRRAQVLQTIASGPAMVASIAHHSPATTGSVPAASAQWQTISNYLRHYFLGRPVCVLTQSGRVTGQLLDVTPSDIVLSSSDGQPKRLAFSAILSVGHLA